MSVLCFDKVKKVKAIVLKLGIYIKLLTVKKSEINSLQVSQDQSFSEYFPRNSNTLKRGKIGMCLRPQQTLNYCFCRSCLTFLINTFPYLLDQSSVYQSWEHETRKPRVSCISIQTREPKIETQNKHETSRNTKQTRKIEKLTYNPRSFKSYHSLLRSRLLPIHFEKLIIVSSNSISCYKLI